METCVSQYRAWLCWKDLLKAQPHGIVSNSLTCGSATLIIILNDMSKRIFLRTPFLVLQSFLRLVRPDTIPALSHFRHPCSLVPFSGNSGTCKFLTVQHTPLGGLATGRLTNALEKHSSAQEL